MSPAAEKFLTSGKQSIFWNRNHHREQINNITEDNVNDYKNIELLESYCNERNEILARSVTGLNRKDHRRITRLIKFTRALGLIKQPDQFKVN